MWIKEVLGVEKPVIAMCHLLPLPGDPDYDKVKGMAHVAERARRDLQALQDGGVDVLWDPCKSFDLAAAVDARFVREIFTGVYASDFGLWNTDYGETIRHKHSVGAGGVRALFNIVPEAAKYLADREIESIARSTVFNNRPDALCVSGLTAGAPADTQILRRVKQAVPDTVVFVNTGVTLDNVEEQLAVADGCVTGTFFKRDGQFYNEVDEERVHRFMEKVKNFR